MAWRNALVSMELSDEDKLDNAIPMTAADAIKQAPDYPWGLRIVFEDRELDKLGLDADCEVGDEVEIRAVARVTSVSRNEVGGEEKRRVELQITDIAVEGDDDDDDDDDDD